MNTFATSSQPVGSTQRALQASLTDSVVFASKAIVHAIFRPSKVDDQTIADIIANINHDKHLKAARDAVLSRKLAKSMKYEPTVSHQMHVSERADFIPLDYAI